MESEILTTRERSKWQDIDPCSVCCLIIIILGIIGWAYSASPFLTGLFFSCLGLFIAMTTVSVYVGKSIRRGSIRSAFFWFGLLGSIIGVIAYIVGLDWAAMYYHHWNFNLIFGYLVLTWSLAGVWPSSLVQSFIPYLYYVNIFLQLQFYNSFFYNTLRLVLLLVPSGFLISLAFYSLSTLLDARFGKAILAIGILSVLFSTFLMPGQFSLSPNAVFFWYGGNYIPFLYNTFGGIFPGLLSFQILNIIFGITLITIRKNAKKPKLLTLTGLTLFVPSLIIIIGNPVFYPIGFLIFIPLNVLIATSFYDILQQRRIERIAAPPERELLVERPAVTPREEPPEAEQVTIKTVSTVEADRCVFCGGNFPEELDICPECGEERVKCSVCQLKIIFGDNVIRCPHCGVLSHRDHILEWIKIRGFCPNCREILSENEITK
ncbi:MAG: RING finger protein [Candidatus Lokiarchaeia archaeon]